MWTVFVLFSLGVLHCTVSSSPPSPINVTFSSVNLRNILQWFPGNGTPGDAHFTVQYAIYGDSVKDSKGRRPHWRAVQTCTEIVRSWCDLSNETSGLEQGYFSRVRAVSRRASSKWVLTRRFDPKSDTTFGPPLVSVDIEDNSAIITLKGPMRYQPDSHTPMISMATFYPQMMYNLSIHNTHTGQMRHFSVVSSQNKYLLEYKTEYCFSARTKFLSMPVKCQSSAWQCLTTPPDPLIGQMQRMVVGIVVPSVCLCILVVVGYILHHYLTGKGQKSPTILKPPSFHPPPLTFNPENINFLITVIQPSDIESSVSGPACSKRWQRITDPPPGYAPQRSETPPVPEEPWDDVSIDYACVGVAPKINDRGGQGTEERKRRHDGGVDGNSLRGEHQKCGSSHSYKKKEFRVEDGGSTGVCAHQAESSLSQSSTHTCSQTLMPLHTQTEMSTLVQAHACSRLNLVPLNQTQVPLLSFQGAKEVDEEKDRELPGLFINKTPQMGLFHIPLNLQTKMGGEMDGEMRVRANEKIDGGVEEGVPLLSAYASQNITHMSTSHADQSDLLPDDYGVVRLATADVIEKDEEEEEEGTNCIDWDPITGKLVLPQMAIEFTRERALERLMQGEKGRESTVGGEEEVNAMKGGLTLEKVFVRQGSEEMAEAQRELERRGERGSEAGDILTKWNLVISMDE